MAQMNSQAERRSSVRIEVDLPVTWRLVHFDREDAPREARALDISEGGCLLRISPSDRLQVGDVIHVEFEAPEILVSRRGLVVSTTAGVHIAFRSAARNEAPSVMAALGLWEGTRTDN